MKTSWISHFDHNETVTLIKNLKTVNKFEKAKIYFIKISIKIYRKKHIILIQITTYSCFCFNTVGTSSCLLIIPFLIN